MQTRTLSSFCSAILYWKRSISYAENSQFQPLTSVCRFRVERRLPHILPAGVQSKAGEMSPAYVLPGEPSRGKLGIVSVNWETGIGRYLCHCISLCEYLFDEDRISLQNGGTRLCLGYYHYSGRVTFYISDLDETSFMGQLEAQKNMRKIQLM